MTEKRFQKKYTEKNNKVYDTWKEMPITDELDSDSLFNILSHLNSLGEIIDSKIEQGRYCFEKYYELKEENEQFHNIGNDYNIPFDKLCETFEQCLDENEQLKQFKNEVFKLIDKRIDKCEPIDYARNIKGDVPVFDCETATEIRILNELKMELEDD